jgi:hypothetical protein
MHDSGALGDDREGPASSVQDVLELMSSQSKRNLPSIGLTNSDEIGFLRRL